MADLLDDRIYRVLPQRYRTPQNQRREWDAMLRQELGSYLDQIEDSIRGFASARPRMLSILTKYERDETADRILREYVEEKLNGVPLQLLCDNFTRLRGEQHFTGFIIDGPGLELSDGVNRLDRRSVTMAAEPMSPSGAQQAAMFMAPPPRPIAPVAPMSPETPWQSEHVQAVAGPSSRQRVSTAPQTIEAPDTAAPHPTSKRPVDSLVQEEQHDVLPSPTKRAKTSSARLILPIPMDITRFVDMFEVDGEEYIFKDARCGPGWHVIRCNIGKMESVNSPTRFTQHPLEDNVALDHFNQKLKCHPVPPKNKYTEEMIIQKFAYRGKCSDACRMGCGRTYAVRSDHDIVQCTTINSRQQTQRMRMSWSPTKS